MGTVSTFLESFATLPDRERIEAEAPKWLSRNVRRLFALRRSASPGATGPARQALERFEAMGLTWHAEQTSRLL